MDAENSELSRRRARTLTLMPIGRVDEALLEFLCRVLERIFGRNCIVGQPFELPAHAYNPVRGQYLSDALLALLRSLEVPGAEKVLGVTDVDLYTEGLNFVFGQASLGGREALISLARLRQSFYGLPEDETLFRERAVKEAMHELGHSYGLTHCPDPLCVMHFSNSLADTDRKQARFCPRCARILSARLRAEGLHKWGT